MFCAVLSIFCFIFPSLAQISPPDYPLNVGKRCAANEFDCTPMSSEMHCIPLTAIRDCVEDCPDGSDENCGVNKTICDNGIRQSPSRCGKCVHVDDMYSQCLDKKWSHLCREKNVVKCANTDNCVYLNWINDGSDDCADGSDENKCLENENSACRPPSDDDDDDSGNDGNIPVATTQASIFHEIFPQNVPHYERNEEFPCDCADILLSNPQADPRQVYTAYDGHCTNSSQCPFKVVCDFDAIGGGWTLIMRRIHPILSQFNKTWHDYKKGFGNMENGGDFWIGNDRLHSMSASRACANELLIRISLATERRHILSRYDSFHVDDQFNSYKLTLGALEQKQQQPPIEDHLILARNNIFTTFDRRHHCPFQGGGWWTPPNNCGDHALTGEYRAKGVYPGLQWGRQRVDKIEMMIRPQLYTPPVRNN